MTQPAMTKVELRSMLAECDGNMSELGRRLGISRAAANRRVQRAGLIDRAAGLRARNGVPGSRQSLDQGSPNPDVERRRIEKALEKHGNQSAAARALGIGRLSLRRACARLGIT